MYQSKKEGRNTFNFYTRSMNEHISRRLILEQQLRKALERGELEVHYQLIVDSNSGYASGAEALVRWFSPELGSVSPDEFIPIAEQNGLIIPIGMFVLRESILAATQWQSLNECYANFKISVNLSPRQFRTKHLISDIDAVLSEFGVGGGILALEITEGVLMSQHLDVSRVLTQLMERKIELSMDDFGTGYSSLSYLRTFPFSRIKIDRSFIQDLLIDNADYELVVATIQMAKALGLKVIAEGVETSAHFSELRKMGCHYAQGYFFNKPCNYIEFTELLIKRCAESK